MSIQNSVQSGIQWNTASQRRSDMPKIIRTGLGLQSKNNTLLSIDVHKKTNREAHISLGGQYFINPEIPIRFGISPNQSLSFGLGVYISALQFDASITAPMSHDKSKEATSLDVLRLTLNVLF